MRVLTLSIAVALFALSVFPLVAAEPQHEAAGDEFFERKIRPLFAQHCYSCHGRGEKKGGLNLESREAMLAGGESGPVALPGKPDESLLIEAVKYASDLQMPPNGKLAQGEIEALKHWLALGAPWPTPAAGSGNSIRIPGTVTEADRQFWSFQPIRDYAPPAVKQTVWPRRPLDNFILAQLEAAQIEPVEPADPRTFIRRATFDLIGLPPTPMRSTQFVAACAEARAAVPSRSCRGCAGGHERTSRPVRRPDRSAARIAALRRALGPALARRGPLRRGPGPYVPAAPVPLWLSLSRLGRCRLQQRHALRSVRRWSSWPATCSTSLSRRMMSGMSRLPALGFVALGPVYYGGNPTAKMDEYDDRLDTTCRGLMGLTVACARCHDHKFDPISTREYYGLVGVFASSEYFEAPLAPADVVKRYDEQQAQIKHIEQRLKDAQARRGPQTGRIVRAANRPLSDGRLEGAESTAKPQPDYPACYRGEGRRPARIPARPLAAIRGQRRRSQVDPVSGLVRSGRGSRCQPGSVGRRRGVRRSRIRRRGRSGDRDRSYRQTAGACEDAYAAATGGTQAGRQEADQAGLDQGHWPRLVKHAGRRQECPAGIAEGASRQAASGRAKGIPGRHQRSSNRSRNRPIPSIRSHTA